MVELIKLHASNEEIIEYLDRHFGHRNEPEQKDLDELQEVLAASSPRGRKKVKKKAKYFQFVYNECSRGATIDRALEDGISRFPKAYPKLLQDIENSIDLELATPRRQYQRFKERYQPLLDPCKTYTKNDFYWCVVIKQWKLAAALFLNSTIKTREEYSKRLGDIIANR